MDWKIPKAAKVYEAYTAIADKRITMYENYAEVISSDGSKKYEIVWDMDTYASSDNASYWQKTLGYPVLAVLMLQERLSYDDEIAEMFKGIQWKKINMEYKNDYDKAAEVVLSNMAASEAIKESAEDILKQCEQLDLKYKRKIQKAK